LAKEILKNRRVGYFTKNIMVPEFGEAAFSMKKG
jgi:parvulin-like peptidyl-prolyl isomerase